MPKKNNAKIDELIILEELFLDQLNYKIEAVFSLLKLRKHNVEEIDSFLSQLIDLAQINITDLKKLKRDRS